MTFQVMRLMLSDGERASLGDYELGSFTLFSIVLSNFGTCNNTIIVLMFKLWHVEKYFKFLRILGIINYVI